MNYGTVKIILKRTISSPAEMEFTELDEAIRWVEDRGTVRRLDRGADRDVYSSQFDAAAVEMRTPPAIGNQSVRRRHARQLNVC